MKLNIDQYNKMHSACPSCGNQQIETTLKGVLIQDMTDEDTNHVACQCGWKGITHDLVASPENIDFTTLMNSLYKAELLSKTEDLKTLNGSAIAAVILKKEVDKLTDIFMGFVNGDTEDGAVIVDYLKERGIVAEDDEGHLYLIE